MRRVLIVDDEKDICLLLQMQFRKVDIESDIAHGISGAKKLYIPDKHDFVFLDFNLSDGNGLKLMRYFKDQNPNIKVVICSANDSWIERKRAEKSGALKFLPKPFSKQSVLKIINEL